MLPSRAMKTPQAVRALGARPVYAAAVMLAVFAVGSALVGGCSGNKTDQTTSNGNATPPPVTAAPDTSTTAAGGPGDPVAGKATYEQRCVLCHGPLGKGDGVGAAALNPKPRNHTDGSYMNTRTDEQLLEVIHNGKGAMPAWKGVLTEQQMRDALAYVRTLAVPPYHKG